MRFSWSSAPTRPAAGIRAPSGQPFTGAPHAPQGPPARQALDSVFDSFARPYPSVDSSIGNLPFRSSSQSTMAKTLFMDHTPLIDAYFSPQNLDAVQELLRGAVARRTGFQIGRQSDDQLLIVMRAVYADHAVHSPADVSKEVQRLDRIVLSAVLDKVIANMTSYLAYLRDASRPREPLPLGVATSTKGTKTFEMFRRV